MLSLLQGSWQVTRQGARVACAASCVCVCVCVLPLMQDMQDQQDADMSDGEQREAPEAAGEDVAEEDPELEPETRAAFQLLRESYENTAAFIADLLSDRALQKRVRVIRHVLKPLHHEYAEDLRRHGEGFAETLYFQGDRAAGSWYVGQIVDTMALLQDGHVIQLLDLQPAPRTLAHVKDLDSPSVAEDVAILEKFVSFAVELCSNRAWSQSFWTLSIPYALVGIYATSQEDRLRTQVRLRRTAAAVLKIERLLRNPRLLGDAKGRARGLQKLLHALGTTSWQVSREILIVGRANDWSPTSEELRELCRTIFAGPASTKDALESVFNFLKDSVSVAKHKQMSPWTKYFYTIANRTCAHSGVKQALPSAEDFQTLLRSGFSDAEILSLKPFTSGSTMLGPEFPRPDKLVGLWRKAGFHSNRRSAAAHAYVFAEEGVDFRNVDNAWAGTSLTIVGRV